jgi:dolichyl-phosphate-mannose--protein O-mannosyl transferase
MHFTMARMGTVDTYVVFFLLAAQLCFLTYFMNVVKKGWKTSVLPLFFAVLFFALGFSTKWLVLYGALGMLALLVALRIRDVAKIKSSLSTKYAVFFDHPFLLMLGFVGLVALIYFATYIPDMLLGNSFSDIFKLQFEMYNFHATLTATHTYASVWWSWPILVSPHGYVPLWLASSDLPNGIRSTISVFGNPAVWWVGFACIFVVAERAIRGKELVSRLKQRLSRKKVDDPELVASVEEQTSSLEQAAEKAGRRWDLAAIFIAVMFFFSWISYVLISRATFIYHFYISVPFLCLASAYVINKYWNTKWGKVATIAFFASVVVLFGLFYPVISGAPTDASWIEKLRLFPSWYF